MTIQELYNQIDALQNQLKKLQPLKQEDEQRLWKKFRLEWNYNSNHMEGNTLTYAHTELLLFFGKSTGDYDKREQDEMVAHDVAIKMVVELAKDKERDLTENFVRQLNEIILVRPFWKEAITPDGQPTRREITPGEYKQFPNSVRLENGEIFHYSSPEETPALMNDLIQFYKTNAASTDVHPVWLAAMLHYKFVCIHPFDDGNGRVARLLMNYVLMKNNFPPIIIKDADKKNYRTALNKADTGDLESFVLYVGEQLEWSIKKSIDAGEGKEIEDEGDLDKEIELLKRTDNSGNKVKVKKLREVLQSVYKQSFELLFHSIETALSKFDDLFFEKQHTYKVENSIQNSDRIVKNDNLGYIEHQLFFDFSDPQKYGHIGGVMYTNHIPQKPLAYPEIFNIKLNYWWKGYKNAGTDEFNVHADVEVELREFKYVITYATQKEQLAEKLYDQPITDTERNDIANKIAKKVLNQIQENLKRIKK